MKNLNKKIRYRIIRYRIRDTFKPKNIIILILGLFLAIICLSYLYLLLFGIFSSLKTLNNFSEDMFGFPRRIYYENYIIAFTRLFYPVRLANGGTRRVMFPELIWNTLLFSTLPVIITIMTQEMVAYVCTKYKFRFNKVLHLMVVFVVVMPAVNSLGQKIIFLKTLGFYDNYWALLYGSIVFADYNFLIWYGTFKSVPTDYIEAARIDGAGHYATMFKIIFPMVRVQFVVLFVLGFITKWNNYMDVLTTMPSFPVLSLALLSFQWDTTTYVGWPTVQLAAAMIVAFPCIILFIVFQPLLVGNLTMGGLKA